MGTLTADTQTDKPPAFERILAGKIHNLKNALQVLNVELDLMALPPEEAARRSRIHRQCGYLNRTLMQLLTLYKIEQGATPVTPLALDLYDFADEIVDAAAVFLRPPLQLNVEKDLDDLATAWVDRQALLDIVVSAIDNATRHAKQDILVFVHNQDDWLTLEVHDDGAGFGSEALNRGESKGRTGLGISLAGSVARMHRNSQGQTGSIVLGTSERLGGAMFRVKLPS